MRTTLRAPKPWAARAAELLAAQVDRLAFRPTEAQLRKFRAGAELEAQSEWQAARRNLAIDALPGAGKGGAR